MFVRDHDVEKIKSALTPLQKIQLLRGMMLTRACDNALKRLFLSGEIIYEGKAFAGKGFRSLGQEAIYGAGFLLNRGAEYYSNNHYTGDIAAPMIRDLGVFLCLSNDDLNTAINAQVGKIGQPCSGRDLHLGAWFQGLLSPSAPLAISTCTQIGIALAFKRQKLARVALSFIGEGGTSLGEWHEAINFAAVHDLPMIFCIENNQRALSTCVNEQCKTVKFAHKAFGYGIESCTIDGNDIEEIAATFKLAADYARSGKGPLLIELETMRMCGHAHHDDMLYLGYDPKLGLAIPESRAQGYVDRELYEKYRLRDPILLYTNKLIRAQLLTNAESNIMWEQAEERVEKAAQEVKSRAWPKNNNYSDEQLVYKKPVIFISNLDNYYNFNPEGLNYLQAIAEACVECFKKYPECVIIGEDVALPYGNAFMLFKNISNKYASRFINTPISENALVGACVGMALCGMRPIGEMQFNDFVACAMNQVVNNAAKLFYRLGLNVPMVLRMPYGGLRRAGPFHSQDSAAWFYRVAGLKIMAPSTPIDAFFMLQQAVDDPDPVLFYEHIALYRDSRLRQIIPKRAPALNCAQVICSGQDLTLISYGAYVHRAFKIAQILRSTKNILIEVIDLRYLKPLDLKTCYESIKKTARVLLLGEDASEGSILQMLAAHISTDLFTMLDAPVKFLGSRNTPVPYAPSLEDDYLLSDEKITAEALSLVAY
jgi:2-oxoisovalerate dehydrogenase E1 component